MWSGILRMIHEMRRKRSFYFTSMCGIRKREPVVRRKRDAPGIARELQFQSDLKELAHRARALNPSHASPDGTRCVPCFRMGHLEGDPHIFQDIVLRLVATSVAIDDERRGALTERPSE